MNEQEKPRDRCDCTFKKTQSCQKDVGGIQGSLRSDLLKATQEISSGHLEQLAHSCRGLRTKRNHRYEVHPIGGETEVIMDIHVVIVHNNLILIFSLLLSLRAHALKISLKSTLDVSK